MIGHRRFRPRDFGYSWIAASEDPENDAVPIKKEDDDNIEISHISSSTAKKEDPLPHNRNTSRLENDSISLQKKENHDNNKNDDNHIDDERYVYRPPKRNRGMESSLSSSSSLIATTKHPGGVDLFCCCGAVGCCSVILCSIVGGILLVYAKYRHDVSDETAEEWQLTGSILFILASGVCLCSCCCLCLGCLAGFSSETNHHPDATGVHPHPHFSHPVKEVKLQLRRLNGRYEKNSIRDEEILQSLRLDVVGHMKEVKEAQKKQIQQQVEREKESRKELERRVKKDLEAGVTVKDVRQKYRPIVFYIVFEGDMLVSSLELLRKQVSLVVNLAKPGVDQCVVTVTSPGGAVSQYGLAASQLARLRKAGITLIVCIDTVAASGGYMVAAVADKIYAAPFAIVGSIGVVTKVPNVQRFLAEHKIDAYLMTAGKYKRTIDIIGDVTEEGKAKLTEELNDIHIAFQDHIAFARPNLAECMEDVATGEHWLAVQAKEKGLVDEIMTSDEYLESVCETCDIIEILEKKPRSTLWGHQAKDAIVETIQNATEKFGQSTTEMEYRRPAAMAV